MRKPPPAPLTVLAALALGLTALPACHFHDRLKSGRGHQLLIDTTGMEREYYENGAILFRNPAMRPVSEYRDFILDPVSLESYSAGDRALTPEERDMLAGFFHEAVATELTDHDYPLVVLPGENVLDVRLTLSGLSPSRETNLSKLVDIDPRIGRVTIQAVFRDSSTSQVEAVYLHTVAGAALEEEEGLPEDPWADAKVAMQAWAVAFREVLDEAHGRVD
jgi:hypothetical protein